MSDYPPESRRARREAERRSRRQEPEDQVPRSFFEDLRDEQDEPEFGGGLGARDGGQRPRYPQAPEPDPGYTPRARPRPRYPEPEEPQPQAPPAGYSPRRAGPPDESARRDRNAGYLGQQPPAPGPPAPGNGVYPVQQPPAPGPPAPAPRYSREPQFPLADSAPGQPRQPSGYPSPPGRPNGYARRQPPGDPTGYLGEPPLIPGQGDLAPGSGRPAAPATPTGRRRDPRRGDRGVRWDEPEIPPPLLGQDIFEVQQPAQLRTDRPAFGAPDTRAGGLPVREIAGGPTRVLPAPPASERPAAYAPPLTAEPLRGLRVHRPEDELDDEDEDDEEREPPGPLRLWLLRLTALLLIAWTVLTLVPGSSGFVAMFAAAAPLIAAVAIPVIAFAVHDQRWGCVAVSAIAALMPWALVVGYAAPARAVPTSGPVVRVMTANARLGRADPKQLVAAVHDHAVDVLVVTELTGTLAHGLTVAGLDSQLVPRWVKLDADPSGGIGVWSRFPIDQPEDLPGFSRPAGRMVVRTQQGPVTLIAVHTTAPFPPRFPFRNDAARWQSDLLRLREVARQTGGAQLVVGDFNATPWNADFRVLADAGLADAADVAGRGIRPTWPVWLPVQLLPLDHVLLGGPIGVASIGTLEIPGSDHRGLLVELRIQKTG